MSSVSAQILELERDEIDEQDQQGASDEQQEAHREDSDEPVIIGGTGPVESEGGDETTLEAVSHGGALVVEAELSGQEGYLIVDTGATYTALTSDFARSAGVYPPVSAPEVAVQTAGGLRSTKFGIIDAIQLGDQRLQGVSYTVCDACGGKALEDGGTIVGLLGRNVLDRYRVGVDTTNDEVELVRHDEFDDRGADIEPWLDVEFGRPEKAAGIPPMKITNQSRRSIRQLELEIRCTTVTGNEKTVEVKAGQVRARSSIEVTPDDPIAGCRRVDLEVDSGRW